MSNSQFNLGIRNPLPRGEARVILKNIPAWLLLHLELSSSGWGPLEKVKSISEINALLRNYAPLQMDRHVAICRIQALSPTATSLVVLRCDSGDQERTAIV